MDAETWNRPRSRGMTLLEILVVVILIGASVPYLTASLSRQAQNQALGLDREMAAFLAEEGVELLLAGGFHHWYLKVRPPGVVAPYSYVPTPPVAISQEITLTVAATGAATDDPYNPFVGDQGASGIRIKPWSKFRREYVIYGPPTSGGATTVPRFLECTVKVYYGPDANHVVAVPLYLGNHDPASTDLRGLLWPVTVTVMPDIDPVPAPPNPLIPSPNANLWGKVGAINATRALYDSSYPVTGTYPP